MSSSDDAMKEQLARSEESPSELLAALSFAAAERGGTSDSHEKEKNTMFSSTPSALVGGSEESHNDDDDNWIDLTTDATSAVAEEGKEIAAATGILEDRRTSFSSSSPLDESDNGKQKPDEIHVAQHVQDDKCDRIDAYTVVDPELGEEKNDDIAKDTTFCWESASDASASSSKRQKTCRVSCCVRISVWCSQCRKQTASVSVETKAILCLLAAALLIITLLSSVIKIHQNLHDDGNRIFGHRPTLPEGHSTLDAIPLLDDDVLPNDKKTHPPTLAPTTTGVGKVMERLGTILQGDADFDNPHLMIRSSPQYQAVVWLATTRHLEDSDEENDQQFLQWYVLATCYFAWNGKEWKDEDDTDWLSPKASNFTTTVCDWRGVECQDDEVVTSLQLAEQDLWGTIVSELGLLSLLETLDLSQNYLGGTIPSELGRLTLLHTLDLSNNQHLSGSFPVELTTLSNLTSLHVQGNPDLSAGMRNFMPCDLAPPTLVADCGLPSDNNSLEKRAQGKRDDHHGDNNRDVSPPKQPQVLCPCCTECCHYTDPATTTKGELICLQHEPYIDQKSLGQYGSSRRRKVP